MFEFLLGLVATVGLFAVMALIGWALIELVEGFMRS